MSRSVIFSAAALLCAAALPASAEQTADGFRAACKLEYAQGAAQGDACLTKKLVTETDRVNTLAAQIEKQAQDLSEKNRCTALILDAVDSRRFTKQQVMAAYGGTPSFEIFQARSCEVARSLGL